MHAQAQAFIRNNINKTMPKSCQTRSTIQACFTYDKILLLYMIFVVATSAKS